MGGTGKNLYREVVKPPEVFFFLVDGMREDDVGPDFVILERLRDDRNYNNFLVSCPVTS